MPLKPSLIRPLPYQLYNEDCFETFKRIKDGSIDLVLCDPPYGTTQNKWDSIIPLDQMWKECRRVSKVNSAIVLTATQPFTSVLVISNLRSFKYIWTWKKSKPTGHLNAKKMPMRNTEDVCIFCDSITPYFPQGTRPTQHLVRRTNRGNYGACSKTTEQTITGYPTTLIEFATENGNHPTQKPVALMEYLIKTYTNEGDIVLDFAMGSGTTGVACMNLNRKFIGCDSDKEHGYFQIAQERIKKAYNDAK